MSSSECVSLLESKCRARGEAGESPSPSALLLLHLEPGDLFWAQHVERTQQKADGALEGKNMVSSKSASDRWCVP